MFEAYAAPRREHDRETGRENRIVGRVQLAQALPLTHESVVRSCALSHLRAVLVPGDIVSLRDLADDGARLRLETTAGALDCGMGVAAIQDEAGPDGIDLEPDVEA